MKPCHDVELLISQVYGICDVRLEFHKWQGEYMTPSLCSMTISPLFPFLDSEEAVLPGGLGPNWERGVDRV